MLEKIKRFFEKFGILITVLTLVINLLWFLLNQDKRIHKNTVEITVVKDHVKKLDKNFGEFVKIELKNKKER